jgi:Tfp pilus assembly protein PilE
LSDLEVMGSSAARRTEAGFTLVEVMIAALVLVVGVLGTLALVDGANRATSETKRREGGTSLARELLERAHAVPYSLLTPTTLEPQLKAQSGLEDELSQTGGWQIRRRGVTYTITTSVCSYDAAPDGVGPHDGSYCGDSPGGGSGAGATVLDFGASTAGLNVDGSLSLGGGTPEDLKRVVVDVTWGTNKTVRQTALIANPGGSAGPGISLFAAVGISNPVVTSVSQVVFNLTTLSTPAKVKWYVDGQYMGDATSITPLTWFFNWSTASLPDGAYEVQAQAFDANGLGGVRRSLTITLDRNTPGAPGSFLAGKNGSITDFEWQPASDGDIVGYRVYRQPLVGSPVQVCALTTSTNCYYSQGALDLPGTFYVVAVDKHGEGAHSSSVLVTTTNLRPNPPTSLTASISNGNTILHWTAPAIGDLDGTVTGYRIYRDGTSYASRYGETGSGTTVTFTDTHTDANAHTYYVTSVDNLLYESTLLGPVVK